MDMAGVVGLREVRYGYEGANHLTAEKDTSNPYFTFDASKCIVCSRCVRACDEQQGTLALTIQNRGFESSVSASQNVSFMGLRVRFLRAPASRPVRPPPCREEPHRGTAQAEHSITTTCAYCGVGLLLPRRDEGRGSRSQMWPKTKMAMPITGTPV